jgi:hypothetical protein
VVRKPYNGVKATPFFGGSRPVGIQEELRQAIDDSGLSLYRIRKDTGMDHTVLHNVYHCKVDARASTMERVMDYLGLQCQLVPKPKTKAKRSK